MAFAVVGIQAHFSKTLLLFFLPQIFNFVLSCPQLFGLVPCPRHRVPRYAMRTKMAAATQQRLMPSLLHQTRFDKETGLLYPSKAEFQKPPSPLATAVLKVFSALRFVKLSTNAETGRFETTNLTILNVFLVNLGPMKEDSLVKALISTQVSGCTTTSCDVNSVFSDGVCPTRSQEVSSHLPFDMGWHGCCMMAIDGRLCAQCVMCHTARRLVELIVECITDVVI